MAGGAQEGGFCLPGSTTKGWSPLDGSQEPLWPWAVAVRSEGRKERKRSVMSIRNRLRGQRHLAM